MIMYLTLICGVAAYLVCGINPAILLSKAIYHEDIREKGSNNPGFTNFKRVYGMKWAWLVFVLDIGKGVLCVLLGRYICGCYADKLAQIGAATTAIFAILGHVYPIWYGFKGGKGFLVSVAAMSCIDWRAGLVWFGLMCVLLLITKYMSLATTVSSLSVPIVFWLTGVRGRTAYLSAAFCIILLFYRHKDNYKKLIEGTEAKFSFGKQK